MNNFCELTNSELLNVDGGFSWGVVWTGVKVAGAVLGVGAAGVVVGAGVAVGTYYGLKWLLG